MKGVNHYLLIGIVNLLGWSTARLQAQQPNLQHILLRDRILTQNLKDFVHGSNARFVAISVYLDSTDQGYVYDLFTFSYYETVQRYKGALWGEWHHTLLLFYTTIDLQAVCTLTDTTDAVYLQRYGRLLLPRAVRRIPGTKLWSLQGQADGGSESSFKVVKGREIYFYDNLGYDNRLMMDMPVVPERK